MTGIARVGVDTAGGIILGDGQSTVYCNGSLIAVIGDRVTGHGRAPHSSPVMVQGSSTVFAGGIGVCREGDQASCGHSATGSSDTFAN